jgi:hypothetical protein
MPIGCSMNAPNLAVERVAQSLGCGTLQESSQVGSFLE